MKNVKTLLFLLLFSPCFLFCQPSAGVLSATNEAVAIQLNTRPAFPKKKMPKRTSLRPERSFRKGQLDVQMGAGLLPTYLMDQATVRFPPVALGITYRVSAPFSLSITSGHSVSNSKIYTITDDIFASWANSYTSINLKPGFHITRLEDWDFYGGFSFGLEMINIAGNTNGSGALLRETEKHLGIRPNTIKPSFSGFTGVRYVWTPKWTTHLEIGSGVSLVTAGVGYMLTRPSK